MGIDLRGTIICSYRVEELLGEGGMASVWRAEHPMLGKSVAIKVLDPVLARDGELVQRFIDEARIQISLKHPNIVDIENFSPEPLSMVMELVEGRSLEEMIGREVGPIPIATALPLMRQILDAVGHAHAHGIIHRDLKPANVIVTSDGLVKVMDFGIAKILGGSGMTQTGTSMGTGAYMSPEQIKGAKNVDARSDIYSLGVTFYEMLAGRTPFEGDPETESDFAVRMAHVQQEPPDPRTFYPAIPEAVVEVVLRSLSKSAEQRYQTVDELRSALEAAASGEGGPVKSSPKAAPTVYERPVEAAPSALAPPAGSVPAPPTGSTPTTPSKKLWAMVLGGVGVLAVVFVVLLAVVFSGNDDGVSSAESSSPASRTDNVASHAGSADATEPRAPGEWVRIKAGSFTMGSPPDEEGRYDRERQHRVTITRDFWLQATEVTQGQWQKVMGNNPSRFDSCGSKCPVELVSWYEAVAYCNELSKREGLPECYEVSGCSGTLGGGCSSDQNSGIFCEGDFRCDRVTFEGLDCRGYRLPTEAEWEYAARAGTTEARYGDLDDIAWYLNNSGRRTHPVKGKRPNDWGLYDMLGNVWEWCHDWYDEYPLGSVTDPVGPTTGSNRVFRGGSWLLIARCARAADRRGDGPALRDGDVGFRPVRSCP